MQECKNCERLLQRIADLNSELLVLRIAAFEAGYEAGKQHPKGTAKPNSERKRGAQPSAGSA